MCGDRAWGGIVVGADSMGRMASFCTVGFLWDRQSAEDSVHPGEFLSHRKSYQRGGGTGPHFRESS